MKFLFAAEDSPLERIVNAERSRNRLDEGLLTMRQYDNNGLITASVSDKQVEMGGKVYKLTIQIDKLRPKPCPKSKKLVFLAEARRLEQIRAGVSVSNTDRASILQKKTAVCPICEEVYQSAQSLYLHKKKHHHHICAICETNCDTKATCESHEKLHISNDPVLPYKCHSCPEKFESKNNVRLHIRVMHFAEGTEIGKMEITAAKNFPEVQPEKQITPPAERVGEIDCNDKKEGGKLKKVQGRAAASYGDVTFTCRVCCKDFSTVEAAEAHTKDHMEVVEEEHKCNICKKLFKNDTTLNEHLAEHLSRALRCPVCPKAFINRATLRIHMKSHGQG